MPSHRDRTCPTYRIENFGREREPVIVIDDFSGIIGELAAAGRTARYSPAQGYPGMRSPVDAGYLALGEPLLGQLLAKHFGLTKRFQAESCSWSVVSVSPDQLAPAQRRPHYDAPQANVIAIVHYTQGAGSGGTAFYRHRRTGFEAVNSGRVAAYEEAVRQDDAEFGPLPAGYYYGDSERYELIGEIEPRPDRLVAYRGRQLHSGVIPVPPDGTTHNGSARLTINTFLIGEV